MTNTQTCTCTESSSRGVHTYRHTHTHTRTHTCKGMAQTRHNRGRTSAHAHTAGQTGGRFRLHWQSLQMSAQGWSSGLGLPATGLRFWLLWATSVCWGRRETVSAAQHWQHSASPGPSQATRHHSWLYTRCTGFGGRGFHSNQFDCGTEFSTPFALRVSMPLGGKYKRCLCLKPNVGVSGSPGLCPSFGPELLATEGWAETRGRPPSYARHGSSV